MLDLIQIDCENLLENMNEDQDHSNWRQTTELSNIYHHTKLERNQFVSVQTQALFLLPLQSKILSL